MSGEKEAGQPQPSCGSCGAEIRPGNAFCTSCGDGLVIGNEDPEQIHAEASPGGVPGEGRRDENDAGLQETGAGRGSHSSPGPGSKGGIAGYADWFSQWFKRERVVAGMVVIAVLVVLVLLSPLALLVAVVIFAVAVTVLIVQVHQLRPVKGWGIVAVTSLVLAFTFGGISYGLYGNDSSTGANSIDLCGDC